MRRLAQVLAVAALGLGALAPGAAAGAGVGDSTAVGRSRTGMFPLLWQGENRFYVAWSAGEGARAGARALLVGPDGAPVDTVRVKWVQDDIACLERFRVTPPAHSLPLPAGAGWGVEPLDEAVGGPSGRLTVPLSALPQTLDPARMTSLAEKQVGTQIFQGLFGYGGAGTASPRPDLADSVAFAGNDCTLRIAPGARFHDGRPVRAADVVASFERALAPGFHAPRIESLLETMVGARDYREGRAAHIAGLLAIDSLHVSITALPHRGPRLLRALAEPAAWIVPRDASSVPAFAFEPVGSGPFRLVRADSTGVLLAASAGRASGVDTLEFRRVRSPRDAALQFELGRLDLVSPSESDEARLSRPGGNAGGDAAPTVLRQREAAAYYIGMNTRAGWLSDRSHRRALSAAIDRALAVRVLVPGRSAPLAGVLPTLAQVPSDPGEASWAPSPREAAALPRLAPPAAGLSFWVPEGSENGLRMAEYVQAALSRHNVRVRIVSRPWREFEGALDAGQADLFYLSWYADSNDPVAFLAALFGSENQGPAGNRTRYASARVDSLLRAARECPDDMGCLGPLLEAERIALSDAPLIPLFQSVNVTLVRPWVRGLALDPFGCPRYDTVEIVRAGARTAGGL